MSEAGTANPNLVVSLGLWALTVAFSRLTEEQKRLLLPSLTVVVFLAAFVLLIALLWSYLWVSSGGAVPPPNLTPTATAVPATATPTATAASTPTPTPLPKSRCDISEPRPHKTVANRLPVSGSCNFLPEQGSGVWVVIRDEANTMWAQGPMHVPNTGQWNHNIVIGLDRPEEHGTKWGISILRANPQANADLMGRGSIVRLGFALPEGTELIANWVPVILE